MKKNCLLFIMNFILISSANCAIRVLGTASLISHQYESRMHEYIHAINIVSQFGYKPYIVENCANGPTFLDSLSAHIFYSHSNNLAYGNKGINEAIALIAALNHFNFDDNDIIVKFTARYPFASNNFFKIIESNPAIDAFVRINTEYIFLNKGDVFTGCFAMRCGQLKKLLNSLDFNSMQRRWINLETEFAHYVRHMHNNGIPVMYVDRISISGKVAGYNNFQTTW